jgi:hypothetical protein
MSAPRLTPSRTAGATAVETGPGSWRLEIPPGPAGQYRLAQADDYHQHHRRDFAWMPPLRMHLEGRASCQETPGTWGFGLWNDPFSMAILGGGGVRRLPCLPRCAWFFFAGRPNWLSLREDRPGDGLLAATFAVPAAGPTRQSRMLAALPLLALLPGSDRFQRSRASLRRTIADVVRQDATRLPIDPAKWHSYTLEWQDAEVVFLVDGECVLSTPVSPGGPLGCVIWVDNQYAALPPNGAVRYGTLENPTPVCLEIQGLGLTHEGGFTRPRGA